MRKKVAAANKKVTLTRRDPVENLTSEEAIAAYLEAAMDEAGDDPAYIAAVLGDIAKARGIPKLAEDTGMTRGGLGQGADPSLDTALKVTRALGLPLRTEARSVTLPDAKEEPKTNGPEQQRKTSRVRGGRATRPADREA